MRLPEHPDLGDWVDHVRGLGAADVRRARDAHLETCPSCRRTVAQFAETSAIVRFDAEHAPSPAAVRLAESIGVQFAADPVALLPRLVARLVGGLGPAPALAGVRGGEARLREASWQAGPFGLRVRVERDTSSPLVSIVGQVEAAASTGPSAAGLPVVLTTGKHVLARTDTNAFGEFALSCDPAPRLRLRVAVDGARQVSVPLARLVRPGVTNR